MDEVRGGMKIKTIDWEWESPISVITEQIAEDMQKQKDAAIMKCVESCGISVDKEELVKALAYDRRQYELGLKNGEMRAYEQIINLLIDRLGDDSFKELVYACVECWEAKNERYLS